MGEPPTIQPQGYVVLCEHCGQSRIANHNLFTRDRWWADDSRHAFVPKLYAIPADLQPAPMAAREEMPADAALLREVRDWFDAHVVRQVGGYPWMPASLNAALCHDFDARHPPTPERPA